MCTVKCIKDGDGICGKLLSFKYTVKSAKDHYTRNGCKGVRIEQGQAVLQPGPSTTLEGGHVIVCDTDPRRVFWLIHMHPFYPLMAAAAGWLISAHVTSCSSERNWSLFGIIFSKAKNRLALEKTNKLSYIRSNSDSGGTGADKEFALSLADVVIENEEETEE